MKAIAICKKDSVGGPDIGFGWDRWAPVEGDISAGLRFGIFVIVGSGAQLTAIQADPNCVAGTLVTSGGGVRFPELDQTIPAAFRTKLNAFLTAHSLATIPAGTTLLQVIRRIAPNWDYGDTDCWDG